MLVAGIVAFTVAWFGDSGTSLESPLSNEPAQVFTPRKQVPLDAEARQVAGRFILTAVARQNLGESYRLAHPELRQGMSKREWLTGNIPVVYYPAKQIETATFKVDESYPGEAILEVALLPKDADEGEATGLLHRTEEGREGDGGALAGELLGSARGASDSDRPELDRACQVGCRRPGSAGGSSRSRCSAPSSGRVRS